MLEFDLYEWHCSPNAAEAAGVGTDANICPQDVGLLPPYRLLDGEKNL